MEKEYLTKLKIQRQKVKCIVIKDIKIAFLVFKTQKVERQNEIRA
jgi:hypothetical protein